MSYSYFNTPFPSALSARLARDPPVKRIGTGQKQGQRGLAQRAQESLRRDKTIVTPKNATQVRHRTAELSRRGQNLARQRRYETYEEDPVEEDEEEFEDETDWDQDGSGPSPPSVVARSHVVDADRRRQVQLQQRERQRIAKPSAGPRGPVQSNVRTTTIKRRRAIVEARQRENEKREGARDPPIARESPGPIRRRPATSLESTPPVPRNGHIATPLPQMVVRSDLPVHTLVLTPVFVQPGQSEREIEEFARLCMLDAIHVRKEAAICPRTIMWCTPYTYSQKPLVWTEKYLNDFVEIMGQNMKHVAMYTDLGVTPYMNEALKKFSGRVEYRHLGETWLKSKKILAQMSRATQATQTKESTEEKNPESVSPTEDEEAKDGLKEEATVQDPFSNQVSPEMEQLDGKPEETEETKSFISSATTDRINNRKKLSAKLRARKQPVKDSSNEAED